MDGRLYHCFCVILIDCSIGFLMRLPTFGSKRMSRLRKGLWSSGISRMEMRLKLVCHLISFIYLFIYLNFKLPYQNVSG